MPDQNVRIGAEQALRQTMTLDFFRNAALAVPSALMNQFYSSEALAALFLFDEGTEYIDLDESGTPDLAVTPPDFVTIADYTLTLLNGADAAGTFTFTFTGPADPYGTVSFILSGPAFGEPDFTLPGSVKTIGANAFEGIQATAVVIPAGCTAIGDQAFKDCPNLLKIRIPSTVTEIGADVFDGCGTVYVYGAADSAAERYCGNYGNCLFVAE